MLSLPHAQNAEAHALFGLPMYTVVATDQCPCCGEFVYTVTNDDGDHCLQVCNCDYSTIETGFTVGFDLFNSINF